MDDAIDARGRLDEEVFAYRATKDGGVFISWHGTPVVTLSGGKAADFLARIAVASGKEAQLLMAKATGNFKRGNERAAKRDR